MDAFLIALALFAGLMLISSWRIGDEYRNSKVGYLLSNRDVGIVELSSSLVASWIHLIAFVLVSMFVFTKGFAGFFWFILPTVIVFLMMSMVSTRLLAQNDQQFTLSGFIQDRYQSPVLTRIVQLTMIFGIFNAVITNLTAFGGLAAYVGQGSVTYETVVIGIAAVVLLYSLWGGLKSSMRTDMLQTAIMLLIAVLIGGAALVASGGPMDLWQAVQERTATDTWNTAIATNLGLMTLMILVGSSLNDNGFYQRIFAANDQHKVRRAFLFSIPIYLVILIGFGVMAGAAIPLGLEVTDPKLAGSMVSELLLGKVGLVLITLAFLAASASTIDTAYNSFGSIVSNDFMPDRDAVLTSRMAMVIMAVIGTAIALFKIDVWILFVTFGAARLMTIAPILYATLSSHRAQVRFMLWGVLASALIGILGHAGQLAVDKWVFSLAMILLPAAGIVADRLARPRSNV